MRGDGQQSYIEVVEWAKALITVPLSDDVTGELIETLTGESDHRAEMGAWALGFGETPAHLQGNVVHALLNLLHDTTRHAAVRGQAAESVAEQLEFVARRDPLRQEAEARLLGVLNDTTPDVRFWTAFALGRLGAKAALPALRTLTMDVTPLPGWWTVGEEAADAIDRIKGREPPLRASASCTS